ncbi:RNA-directed DNA polymerase, eukaryota [Tanacetum coccineum]
MTHPSPNRNKVPKAVLMRSGLVSLTTTRPVNIAQPRTTVNTAKLMSYFSKTSHSTVKRPINKITAFKNSNFNQRVNAVKDKNVNAVRPKAVLNAVKGNHVNVVKASACWTDFLTLYAGNPQQDLEEKGVIDSGCSRHMTRNMSYLTDFEEIDGGYVAFGGSPKGGKITGRAKGLKIYSIGINIIFASNKHKVKDIRNAVWDCGENKSPGPDGFTFEFFQRYWRFIGDDLCEAVEWFFLYGNFPRGCNSSFIALIPKIQDAKFVSDYRPITLIGSVYKVVSKILANRLRHVISILVSNVQSAFVKDRQILDCPFIINEIISWCKRKKKQAMLFKVDFAKAYDSIRWDFLDDVLQAFGFGIKRSIISVSVILIMESIHLSFVRTTEVGTFQGLQISDEMKLSHLFYADDAVFIGLKININKSNLMGIGVTNADVIEAAKAAWKDTIRKMRLRLSKWKLKTLSIGGRLTLLKSVLGASPIYSMSIYKVPYGVLKEMESIRSRFFNGIEDDKKKIT